MDTPEESRNVHVALTVKEITELKQMLDQLITNDGQCSVRGILFPRLEQDYHIKIWVTRID